MQRDDVPSLEPGAAPAEPLPAPVHTAHALARYREEQVNNLGQKELILMLYDGAIRFCEEARAAIDAQDISKSYEKLVRARDVVTELFAILNPDIQTESVENLRRLYDFCIYGITQTNFTKNPALLDAVLNVLQALRATWAEIDFEAAIQELIGDETPPQAGAAPQDDASDPDVTTERGEAAESTISLTA